MPPFAVVSNLVIINQLTRCLLIIIKTVFILSLSNLDKADLNIKDIEEMFAHPIYVLKDGEIVVENGKIKKVKIDGQLKC